MGGARRGRGGPRRRPRAHRRVAGRRRRLPTRAAARGRRHARAQRRGRDGGAVAVWASGAISDEDRLDRAETAAVMRRSVEFAQPYRRTIWAALGFITAVTLCTVAGPLLVRIATDHGLGDGNGTTLNIVIAVYVAIVIA